jgi:hypothetical protein
MSIIVTALRTVGSRHNRGKTMGEHRVGLVSEAREIAMLALGT